MGKSQPVCSVILCKEKAYCKKACRYHYMWNYRHKPINIIRRKEVDKQHYKRIKQDTLRHNKRKENALNRYSKKFSTIKAKESLYSQTPKGRWVHFKARNKIKKKLIEITEEMFLHKTSKVCNYCGQFSPGKNYCGLDRLDSSKFYTNENIVPCCKICNYMKKEYSVEFFLNHIKKIVNFSNE